MLHRNYIYDCERRYNTAFAEGFTDNGTRDLYRRFQTVKKELEQNTERKIRAERLFHSGRPEAWGEMDKAKRACNGNETELANLAQRISNDILRLKKSRK